MPMKLIKANWTAPANISARTTTRLWGISDKPYDRGNLALHVGDNPDSVRSNRQHLIHELNLPGEPAWLNQTHSTDCITVEKSNHNHADAAITTNKNIPLVILSADCLPIVICNKQGTEIAAIHAGWKGLVNGIINNTLTSMSSQPNELIAWIGPAICQQCYEVGEDVYNACTEKNKNTRSFFKPFNQKWKANLPLIAESILYDSGLDVVFQSGICTFERENELYSYRRGAQTGRIGTFIWFNNINGDE